MAKRPGQAESDFDDLDQSALESDLNSIVSMPPEVPGAVDDAILNRARAHFAGIEAKAGRRGLFVRHRRAWIAAAAIAAVIIGIETAIMLRSGESQQPILAGDLDRNGRVDMLDAFALARRLHVGDVMPASLDLNGDGDVSDADVEWIAHKAVALDGVETHAIRRNRVQEHLAHRSPAEMEEGAES